MSTPPHETGDTEYERDDDSLAERVREKARDAKERVEDEPFERDEDGLEPGASGGRAEP